MTRFCGNCGTGLDAAALASGRCPTCGVSISATGDPLRARDAAPKRDPDIYPFIPASAAQEQAPAPWWPGEGERRRSRSGGGTSVPWVIGAAAVAVVLLFGTLAYVLAQRGGTTSSSQVGTPSPAATAAPATATPVATATPTQEAPTPTVTPTGTPISASLSVQPTKFQPRLCIASAAGQIQFTVANMGEAPLTWTATSDHPYEIDPSSGTLDGGDHVAVTVSNIQRSGTVTITAPGAQNSPQTVTIICTV